MIARKVIINRLNAHVVFLIYNGYLKSEFSAELQQIEIIRDLGTRTFEVGLYRIDR